MERFIKCLLDGANVAGVEERLSEEIATWRERLDDALGDAAPLSGEGERFLENIRAYRADTDHFEQEEDLVRAFEAIVWAWAWLEIGAETGAIDWTYPEDGFDGVDPPSPD